jgi:hypothetical protein
LTNTTGADQVRDIAHWLTQTLTRTNLLQTNDLRAQTSETLLMPPQ